MSVRWSSAHELPARWLPLLLFFGAVGKSAQFPLHVWLPDAMEGPTPVSALIHAATMVAAGVYLVAATVPALRGVGRSRMITVMLCRRAHRADRRDHRDRADDIKRVLAYSTISQLGYMILGAGRRAVCRAACSTSSRTRSSKRCCSWARAP